MSSDKDKGESKNSEGVENASESKQKSD